MSVYQPGSTAAAFGAVTTVGTFGSTPNTGGASISGTTLTLQPANGTNPGGVSTTTQTIAGAKTFSGAFVASSTLTVTGVLTANAPAVVNGALTVNALATPVNAAFSTATTGGSLTAATYYYRVTAVNSAGETLASTETSQVVPAGTATNVVVVNWGAVTGAASYNVYGRTTGAETKITASIGTTGLTYTDTGSSLSGALPTVNSTGNVTLTEGSSIKLGASAGETITGLNTDIGILIFGGSVSIAKNLAMRSNNGGSLSIGTAGSQFAVINSADGSATFAGTMTMNGAAVVGTTLEVGTGLYMGPGGASTRIVAYTAPTISGSGTGAAVTGPMTAAFEIDVGTTPGGTGTITFPTAAHGWNVSIQNITNPATSVVGQTGGSTTTATFANYVRTTGVAGNFSNNDKLRVIAFAY